MTKLHEVIKNENEIQNLLNFCIKQEFRVIQIQKSLNEHMHNVTIGTLGNNLNKTKVSKSSNSHKIHSTHSVHSFKSSPIPSQFVHNNEQCNQENSSLRKPFPLRKSLNSHGSSSSRSSKNPSQSSSSSSSRSSHEKSSFENASYLTLLERRRTADHAEILVKKAEERTERKLELLQKSFECEKEKNLEEFEEAKYNVEFANSEIFTSKKSCLPNEKENFELPPYQHESFNNNPLHRTFLPVKSKKTYNCDKINEPKASNNANDGDIFHPIKSKIEPFDAFIDDLIEGQETNLRKTTSFVVLQFSLKQEYETRTLPPIELRQFSGNPVDWPEFIENFRSRVHFKTTFDDNLRMERLCSVLDGEAKRVIETIGKSGRFYVTALKTLKRDFGNPLLVSHAKPKLLFDQTQIKGVDRMSLPRFHQHLKIHNTWLLSMGYDTPILLTKI